MILVDKHIERLGNDIHLMLCDLRKYLDDNEDNAVTNRY